MTLFLVLLSFLACFNASFAETEVFVEVVKSHESLFQRPTHIPEHIWNAVSPYFIPQEHPALPFLDNMFSGRKRVILSPKTLKQAGFKNTKPGKYSKTTVVTHKNLPGYLLKLYTDDLEGYLDWAKLLDRVLGANATRESVENHGWGNLFKVPKKWIYPLPAKPSPPKGVERKNFILLVEDMDLQSSIKNLLLWKSNDLPEKTLDCLYLLLREVGLYDSPYAFNLPFSKDGKIAVIDTEFYHMWPVKYRRLSKYLSQNRREYWKVLVHNKGPVQPLAPPPLLY